MNLDKEIYEAIRKIAAHYQGIIKVVLFGSRARGEAHERSDIDLGIYGCNNLNEFIYELEEKVPTLLQFDITNMDEVEDLFFIEQVKKDEVILYEKP